MKKGRLITLIIEWLTVSIEKLFASRIGIPLAIILFILLLIISFVSGRKIEKKKVHKEQLKTKVMIQKQQQEIEILKDKDKQKQSLIDKLLNKEKYVK